MNLNTFYFPLLVQNVCLLFVLINCLIASTESRGKHPFYSTATLTDGVHELRVFADGVRVKQTVAGPREGSPRGLVARQMSTARQVLSLIYNGVPSYLKPEEGSAEGEEEEREMSPVGTDEDGLQLRDCKVERDVGEVRKFIRDFDEHATNSQSGDEENVAELGRQSFRVNSSHVSALNRDAVPSHLQALLKFKELKHKCFRLKRKIRKYAKAEYKHKQREAKNHNNTLVLQRPRRGVTNLLSIPNTKWCGKGYSANSYDDLGGLFEADSCCRQHDLHCPFFIRSFQRKYGHFHFGLGTISHCSCDRRFKTCLKQSGTGAADMVGNVFFRIVKSSCFDFVRKKVCKKRGFWKCLRWGYEKQAVIRNSVPWNY